MDRTAFGLLDIPVAYESPVDGWSVRLEVIRLCLTYLRICSRCYKCHNMNLWDQTGKKKKQDNRCMPLSFTSKYSLTLYNTVLT